VNADPDSAYLDLRTVIRFKLNFFSRKKNVDFYFMKIKSYFNICIPITLQLVGTDTFLCLIICLLAACFPLISLFLDPWNQIRICQGAIKCRSNEDPDPKHGVRELIFFGTGAGTNYCIHGVKRTQHNQHYVWYRYLLYKFYYKLKKAGFH
jgi:hypothetical protein